MATHDIKDTLKIRSHMWDVPKKNYPKNEEDTICCKE